MIDNERFWQACIVSLGLNILFLLFLAGVELVRFFLAFF